MDEATYRLADILVKVGAAVFGLVGAAMTVFQYRASQTQARAKLAVERRALAFNLSKQKADLLAEAAQTAATIATSKEPDAIQKAIDRFWQLYFGPLLLVEGKDVEEAMVQLGEHVHSYRHLQGRFGDVEREVLQAAALRLGAACRKEITALDKGKP